MRIDHIVHQFPPEARGGLETYVFDLARAQRASGDRVEIVSGSLEAKPQFTVESSSLEGLEVTRLHRADLYFDAWDKGAHPEVESYLRERWARERPDLVHIHHWIRLSENLVEITRDLGIPSVVTLHDFAPSCPRAFRMYAADNRPCLRETRPENCGTCAHRWPWLSDEQMAAAVGWFRRNARAELSGAGARLCASSAVAEIISAGLGLDSATIDVIPLGYERRFAGQQCGAGSGDVLRVAYWGSVTERKGVPLLARALARVQEAGHAVHLEVFGRIDLPELETEIREAAATIPHAIHGAYEYEALARAEIDVAVFPSLCLETYGLVVDEAQELGLPLIVPAEGAMAERIGGGGLTFAIGDEGELADRLLSLASDAPRLQALRDAVAEPGRSFDEHLAALTNVYHRVLAAPVGEQALEPFSPEERRLQAMGRAELHRCVIEASAGVDVDPLGPEASRREAFEHAEDLFRRLLGQ